MSWKTANKKQGEKLLELIRRLAEDDKDGVMAHKVLKLFIYKTFFFIAYIKHTVLLLNLINFLLILGFNSFLEFGSF